MDYGTVVWIALVAIAVLVLLFMGYLKAPPDTAYIVSGPAEEADPDRSGRAGASPSSSASISSPCSVMQVDVKDQRGGSDQRVHQRNVVDGVANVKISSDPDLLATGGGDASRHASQPELTSLVTQVLEGNMREIVGSVGLKEMVQDRQGVAKKITENVVPDMQKLGIEVVNFNIQSFKDGAGTIENMGIDNVEQIRKNAQIAKANAQRDIAIATVAAPSSRPTPCALQSEKHDFRTGYGIGGSAERRCAVQRRCQNARRRTRHIPFSRKISERPLRLLARMRTLRAAKRKLSSPKRKLR